MRVQVAFRPDEAVSAPTGIVMDVLREEDIAFCARTSVLDTVPRFARIRGPAAEIVT